MATKAKPGDVTGRLREQQAEANMEELQKRQNEVTMATATEAIRLETEVIDATNPSRQEVIVEAVTTIAQPEDDSVVVRVIDDIDSMTLGAGNHYSFRKGQKYQVTRQVARHLEEKGYLAGMI